MDTGNIMENQLQDMYDGQECEHNWIPFEIKSKKGQTCVRCGLEALYKSQARILNHVLKIEIMKPKIVCYCGSLRKAIEAFKHAELESVIKGEIALLPCAMYVDIEREFGAGSFWKTKADELHKRKIDIADEVGILNVGGYVGGSTHSELEYAKSIGKPIRFLEPHIS